MAASEYHRNSSRSSTLVATDQQEPEYCATCPNLEAWTKTGLIRPSLFKFRRKVILMCPFREISGFTRTYRLVQTTIQECWGEPTINYVGSMNNLPGLAKGDQNCQSRRHTRVSDMSSLLHPDI